MSVFDHWQRNTPPMSFQWEGDLETLLHVSQYRQLVINLTQWLLQGPDLFFSHVQKCSQVPVPPGCLRISWLVILRMKISPSSQKFGHGQCQESYLLGLIYKLPHKFILTHVLFPFWQDLRTSPDCYTIKQPSRCSSCVPTRFSIL